LPSVNGQATVSDFVLGIVAFIGITGWLPYGVKGTLDGANAIAQEALKRALELLAGKTNDVEPS
jgi:hypothetical protein